MCALAPALLAILRDEGNLRQQFERELLNLVEFICKTDLRMPAMLEVFRSSLVVEQIITATSGSPSDHRMLNGEADS